MWLELRRRESFVKFLRGREKFSLPKHCIVGIKLFGKLPNVWLTAIEYFIANDRDSVDGLKQHHEVRRARLDWGYQRRLLAVVIVDESYQQR